MIDSTANILLVDDRPENLMALEAVLEPLGLPLQRANSGAEALKYILQRDFAVVLMDVQMPNMNGFETARLIKARHRSKHIPIIFLTAISKDEEYVFEGYSVGAVDYIFKPFQPEILKSKVSVFIELHEKNRQLVEQEDLLRDAEKRELALRHEAELRATESRAARELATINKELKASERQLREAMEARSRFYANMSHELRTPINAILGYTALLRDDIYGPLNEAQAKGVQRANKAGQHLLELVNDILDLSKIEAGKFDLVPESVRISSVIRDLFVTVQPLADEHGSELSLRVHAEPDQLTTDTRRVRQIVLNLLSNAIKFGEGKPICVVCHSEESGGVEIEVIDRGAGIAPEDQDKVFEEFVQLSGSQQHKGTGLGLPISRKLAALLGGSLSLKSASGEGTTFRLVLPARLPGRAEPGKEE
jgi:signal transduction histidine kinase